LAEQESVIANILTGLRSQLDGMTIPFGNTDKTATCAMQRTIRDINGDYPFIEIALDEVTKSNESVKSGLYSARVVVYVFTALNDDDLANDPISYQARNTASYVLKQVMSDTTIGGKALNMDHLSFGQEVVEYTDAYGESADSAEFLSWIVLDIQFFMNRTDPFILIG